MSEPRKNHLNIDGGQIKQDDNVATYKAIPEADGEFRSTKPNLSKSKEKVSEDGAEEKLLPKEEEAKIVTRVDMADAKYVVGDHRNGDAKIELDANKRQFSGLTKEELLKYAEEPFWVRLRWFLFILFWALWLCMLAGAIVIIVRAPKCDAPLPHTWYQQGPLVDLASDSADLDSIVKALPALQTSKVQGIFLPVPAYEVLDDASVFDKFKPVFEEAKKRGIRIIVDLCANVVSESHRWFQLSQSGDASYENFFIWRKGAEGDGHNWVSLYGESAWAWSSVKKQNYLQQVKAGHPDLNLHEPEVVGLFDRVLTSWVKFGAAGVRLQHFRQALVNMSFPQEEVNAAVADKSLPQSAYGFWTHRYSADQPGLEPLLTRWKAVVDNATAEAKISEPVFTIAEVSGQLQPSPELFVSSSSVAGALRPAFAAPVSLAGNLSVAADVVERRLPHWPALQLVAPEGAEGEAALLALLLPAAPVFTLEQVYAQNQTDYGDSLLQLVSLRGEASVAHGQAAVRAVPALNSTQLLLAVARWKAGKPSYVGVFNPSTSPQRANLTALPALSAPLEPAPQDHARLNLTYKSAPLDDVPVPPLATVVLQYVPHVKAEN